MTRPITAELFASLDLVVDEPQDWHFPWVGERMLAEIAREQQASALLLGRRTYDVFAASWPQRGDEVPLAEQLNGMPKIVVSDRMRPDEASWSRTRILRPGGNLAAAIRSLDGAGRITVAGSISLVEQLLAVGLLDELRLIVHPLVRGRGRRLFSNWDGPELRLCHVESAPLDRGARLDVYRKGAGEFDG